MESQGKDRGILKGLIASLKDKARLTPPGELILKIGRFFLGSPYASGTLDTKGSESLVVNLRGFDCFTFVENVVALSRLFGSHGRSFKAFRNVVKKIRYRRGRLQGYASRLHYFSDWIHDNERKGILRDVTAEIGGKPRRKAINFMTIHPELYPQLKKGENLRRMKAVERTISGRSLYYIPKKSVRAVEKRIEEGDIVAITTETRGLDVEHVGLAVRVNTRIHLLHASRNEGKVVLSKETLYRYLMQSRSRSGITVARIL